MSITNYSEIKNDNAIRLIVGLSEYNQSSLVVTNMLRRNYPFDTAAFVVNDVKNCNTSELNSFRRVLGMIFSPTVAEDLVNYWKQNNFSGPRIALDLKKHFQIYFSNYSEKNNLTTFIKQNNTKNLKIILFTVKSFEDPIFENSNAEIFKYTHPSQRGSTQQLFDAFDYCSKHYGFSSADDIEQKFSIK
ncbi:hypothetical protein [Ligilactobacillus animalis]|uniref:hypothetical protein n=1 Tax=Ligilactobacillus animalis TaxID=1605 RepID=UPI002592CE88|nr:hypothetical protein [Ligilactobacillus animalis]